MNSLQNYMDTVNSITQGSIGSRLTMDEAKMRIDDQNAQIAETSLASAGAQGLAKFMQHTGTELAAKQVLDKFGPKVTDYLSKKIGGIKLTGRGAPTKATVKMTTDTQGDDAPDPDEVPSDNTTNLTADDQSAPKPNDAGIDTGDGYQGLYEDSGSWEEEHQALQDNLAEHEENKPQPEDYENEEDFTNDSITWQTQKNDMQDDLDEHMTMKPTEDLGDAPGFDIEKGLSAFASEDTAETVGLTLGDVGSAAAGIVGGALPLVGLGLGIYDWVESGLQSDKEADKINQYNQKVQQLQTKISSDEFASKVGAATPKYGSLAAPGQQQVVSFAQHF